MQRIFINLALITCSMSSCLASSPGDATLFRSGGSSDSESSGLFRSSSPQPKEISAEERIAHHKKVFGCMMGAAVRDFEAFLADPSEKSYSQFTNQFSFVNETFSKPENTHLSEFSDQIGVLQDKASPAALARTLLARLQFFYDDFKEDTTDQKLKLMQTCFLTLEKLFKGSAEAGDMQSIVAWRKRLERKEIILKPGAVELANPKSPRGQTPRVRRNLM